MCAVVKKWNGVQDPRRELNLTSMILNGNEIELNT